MPEDDLIQHVSELPAYSPPAHHGTVNRRLVTREFGAGFEMILGQLAPGGEASRHYHVDEAQVVYILKGEADVALGDEPPRRCGPGTVDPHPQGADARGRHGRRRGARRAGAVRTAARARTGLSRCRGSKRRCASTTKNRRCSPASSASRGAGRSSTRSRSASSSTRPISCRCRRRTSWPTPNRSARPGCAFLEGLAALPEAERRVRVPTITDPRGLDFADLQAARPDRGDGGARGARDRGVARLRRADDRYLHQLPDDHAAGARRASGDGRHRRRDLFEQRVRRAQQFRGRAVGAGRRR